MTFPHLKFPQNQEIHFDNGHVREVRNITSVNKGKWTHLICDNERGKYEVIVNPDRVLFINVRNEEIK